MVKLWPPLAPDKSRRLHVKNHGKGYIVGVQRIEVEGVRHLGQFTDSSGLRPFANEFVFTSDDRDLELVAFRWTTFTI